MKKKEFDEILSIATKLVFGTETFRRDKDFYKNFKNNKYYKTEDGETIGAMVYDNHAQFKEEGNKSLLETDAFIFMHGKSLERFSTVEYMDIDKILSLAKRPLVFVIVDYRMFGENTTLFTQNGCAMDIDAGFKWTLKNYSVKNTTFIGHSFGCALTVDYFRYKYALNKKIEQPSLIEAIKNTEDSIEFEENAGSSDDFSTSEEEYQNNKVKNKISKINLDEFKHKEIPFDGSYLPEMPKCVFLLAPFSTLEIARQEYVLSKIFKDTFTTYDKILSSLFRYNTRENLKLVKKPILMHGLSDVILGPKHTEDLANYNKHADVLFYEKLGHLQIFTDLKVWKDIFRIFYEEHP